MREALSVSVELCFVDSASDIDAVACREFGEDCADVGLDGGDAEEEVFGNMLVAVTVRDSESNVAFTICEGGDETAGTCNGRVWFRGDVAIFG